MAAGLTKRQIDSRVCYRLQRLAREEGGQYVSKRDNRKTHTPYVHSGPGVRPMWLAWYEVSNMSNGETAGTFCCSVWDVQPSDKRDFRGVSLGEAVAKYQMGAA